MSLCQTIRQDYQNRYSKHFYLSLIINSIGVTANSAYVHKMKLYSFLIPTILIHSISAANILIVGLLESVSHRIWYEQLIGGLVQAGHNITLLSYADPKLKLDNYTVIKFPGNYLQKLFVLSFKFIYIYRACIHRKSPRRNDHYRIRLPRKPL